ncbi:probable glutathione reductase [Oceanicaulis sp. HTCC2633]|uniref:dihydrolipoyl dehydrogenase family protein n=1 Tax=Oceanicaulis sp. HTCC2633 TaxID=314254 RepID=UPI00006698C1|nr:NAD(P)/FAD-dependent oxidoreductase [Oceanicaulis sp. HTCC2633]EAP89723.1 probable glutathione reductase [Oceanicaulis sp. HTCC2633]
MTRHSDLLVLGTGNAGMAAAGVAQRAGKSVTLVESGDVGGTCAIRGCVPKKVLVAAAANLDAIARASDHAISVGEVKLDWPALIKRERTFVEGVPEMFRASITNRGMALVSGKAVFTGPNAIDVEGETYTADRIVIATGSKPAQLPIEGWALTATSDDLLTLETLPKEVVFVGGGVIALEFAHIMVRAGAKVTILEAASRVLPRLDEDMVDTLVAHTRSLGVTIQTGVSVRAIREDGARRAVEVVIDGETLSLSADLVVNGAGRRPAVEDLDLEAGGIRSDRGHIEVDVNLRSLTNPSVYVAGDALAASPQMSPVASYEGRIAGENAINDAKESPDYSSIPSAVYTVPAIASVGLDEAGAQAAGLEPVVKVNDMRDWRSAKTYAEQVAFAKVLIDPATDRILGAHLAGHGAEEVIHLFTLAMKTQLTASELAAMTYAYPTFSSDLKFLV